VLDLEWAVVWVRACQGRRREIIRRVVGLKWDVDIGNAGRMRECKARKSRATGDDVRLDLRVVKAVLS
jgi:hypothetical protein